MSRDNTGGQNPLEEVRRGKGEQVCRETFQQVYQSNRQRAVTMLNDPALTFPTLLALRGQILATRLRPFLNNRNKLAMEAANHLLEPEDYPKPVWELSDNKDTLQKTLLWMVESSAEEEQESEELQQVWDSCVTLLLHRFHQTDLIPLAEKMIFRRHKKGQHIHYLVWAVFATQHPDALSQMAEYLRSNDPGEARLACKILQVDSPVDSRENREESYRRYLTWLEENDPYLYFTRESNQYSSEPKIYRVDWDRKYLNQKGEDHSHHPAQPEGEVEEKTLQAFRSMTGEEQRILSDYSQKLRRRDPQSWRSWMKAPVEGQLHDAKEEKT